MAKDAVFLCGYRKGPKLKLGKAERKAISNFSDFLRGKGSRCCECLHKAKRHWVSCQVESCKCYFSYSDVLATRAQVKAPGWKKDNA